MSEVVVQDYGEPATTYAIRRVLLHGPNDKQRCVG